MAIGPITWMLVAEFFPKIDAGIKVSVPTDKLSIMFPMLLFSGKLLNAALICAIRVPAGHVIVTTEFPAGKIQVQGASNVAVGHAAL